jgi:hypothetical protein
MYRTPAVVGCLVLSTGLLCGDERTRASPPAKQVVDFRGDVQPIFARSCVACHGAAKQRGGLRLDDGAAALKGGNSGVVIIPGKAAESRLLQLVAGLNAELRMPPEGKPPLAAKEVGILRAWIDQGAGWPQAAGSPTPGGARTTHWAFQPIRHPAPPPVADVTWPRNGIDRFVLARLAAEKLAPSPEADRVTLLRRLSLDLVGLPPAPCEVDDFLADSAPGAYERQVERLLASPHYGERWARHWLDCARYADSDGYEKDTGRPFAWRYRNWVIDALNRDLPFDQFATEQLAGDLLPGATTEQKVATGFHRNTLTNREGGVDQEQFRVEAVVDRVNTTAKAFLGITLGCAQCHDHKYDPFSQREYYEFFAFFNGDREADMPAPLPHEPPAPPPGDKKAKSAPRGTMAQTLTLGPARTTHVLIRGDFLRPGVEVRPGTPSVFPPLQASGSQPAGLTRLDLARWVVAPENPLTPRVTVNWVWQKFFGRGLVATPEDFGTQGEKPSHPELLDWLASEFVRRGWSLKELHRLIVTSATYRQSSRARPELEARDPLNVLLARQARHRLEAEVLRDQALAASGLLARTVGGPSVRPPQPPGISELSYAGSVKWVESTGPDRYRRGLYTWFQRTSPYPMLLTFDAPDSNVCAVRRERSNTPLQALTLMNDAVFVECAQALGRRVVTELPARSSSEDRTPERVRQGFRLCVGREPTAGEQERLLRLYNDLLRMCHAKPEAAAKLIGRKSPAGVEAPDAAAWVALARVLLNLDEFMTRE